MQKLRYLTTVIRPKIQVPFPVTTGSTKEPWPQKLHRLLQPTKRRKHRLRSCRRLKEFLDLQRGATKFVQPLHASSIDYLTKTPSRPYRLPGKLRCLSSLAADSLAVCCDFQRWPRRREYPQPPPPSNNNTTSTINMVD